MGPWDAEFILKPSASLHIWREKLGANIELSVFTIKLYSLVLCDSSRAAIAPFRLVLVCFFRQNKVCVSGPLSNSMSQSMFELLIGNHFLLFEGSRINI